METPSRFTFAPDGSTNVFQIPVQMKGDNYVRIDIDGTTVNDRNKFDIVNNSIVFVNSIDVPAGSQLDILVVQTDEGIANLGNVNSIDIVAQNILSVNTVATDIAAVVNNSNNIAAIQTVDTNMPAVLNAVQSATDAAASAAAAAASEAASKVSENAAKASENASKASENAASASETAASASETAAAASATAANTSLSNTLAAEITAIQASADADTSKNAAEVSETNAASSAASASTSATNAATSATSAASSATAAAGSATTASAASDAVLAALDSFDDRYLGQKASDPTVDNDGDPLVSGALYFNTTDSVMKVYEGSAWVAAYASLSGALIANNNLSDLEDAAASRANLGLATVAATGAYSDLTGVPSGYGDSDVDTHLNTGTATTDQILAWTGSDYDWVDAGGGGATGGGTDKIFVENGQVVTANYTVSATTNAMTTGPIDINSGVTVTVETGARWVVI